MGPSSPWSAPHQFLTQNTASFHLLADRSPPQLRSLNCGSSAPAPQTHQGNLPKAGQKVPEGQEAPGQQRRRLRGPRWTPVPRQHLQRGLWSRHLVAQDGRWPGRVWTTSFAGASSAQPRAPPGRLGAAGPEAAGRSPRTGDARPRGLGRQRDPARRLLGHLCRERRGRPGCPGAVGLWGSGRGRCGDRWRPRTGSPAGGQPGCGAGRISARRKAGPTPTRAPGRCRTRTAPVSPPPANSAGPGHPNPGGPLPLMASY